jgi:hypothetical protein
MTLSNQSHFPQFFVSPESHLIGLLYPFYCCLLLRCILPELRCTLPDRRCTLPELPCTLPEPRCTLPELRCTLHELRCTLPELAKPRQIIFRCHQITEDDLPGPGQFRLMTSRNWLVPSTVSHLAKSEKRI